MFKKIDKKYIKSFSSSSFIFSLVLSLVFITNIGSVNADTFNRNLKLGDSGPDVLALQQILNINPTTRITSSGVGSPGNETSYFGNLTRLAVIKFQEYFKSTILTPNGLSRGTGVVGPATRERLNLVLQIKNNKTSTVTNTDSQATSSSSVTNPVATDPLIVLEVSNKTISPGSVLKLYGFGFSKDLNTVHFGDSYTASARYSSVVTSNGMELSVIVPTLPFGMYDVWVENSTGSSKNFGPKWQITIGANSVQKPILTSSLPDIVTSFDQIITVTGTGLDTVGNSIHSAFGVINNVNSDGKTLSFKFGNFSLLASSTYNQLPKNVPISFKVISSNGESVNAATFTIK